MLGKCELAAENVKMLGSELKSKKLDEEAGCSALCGETEGCSGWNWSREKTKCFLLNGITSNQSKNDYISGICARKYNTGLWGRG